MILLSRIYFALHDAVMWLAKWLHGLMPLALRLYLAPVMIAAGLHKFHNRDDIVAWFGNADWGLGLPEPEILVTLVTTAELAGGFLLLFGLATRWAALALMVTMAVAAYTVHFENGWFDVTPTNAATSPARPLADLGVPQAQQSLENSAEVSRRLERAKGLLQAHGNYDWLTERGDFVVHNNGMETAVTYYLMLLVLFYVGSGALGADYWLNRRYRRLVAAAKAGAGAEPVAAAAPAVAEPASMEPPRSEPEAPAAASALSSAPEPEPEPVPLTPDPEPDPGLAPLSASEEDKTIPVPPPEPAPAQATDKTIPVPPPQAPEDEPPTMMTSPVTSSDESADSGATQDAGVQPEGDGPDDDGEPPKRRRRRLRGLR